MSSVKISGNASGTGILTIAAPNTNTDRTLTLPDAAGEILSTGSTLSSNLAFSNGFGLDFSATEGGGATSSVLDDYEEGTWTPSVNSGTLTNPSGRYTKIGRTVIAEAYIQLSGDATGATGMSLTNLPLASSADSLGSGVIRYTNCARNDLTIHVNGASTSAAVYTTAGTNIDYSSFGVSNRLDVVFIYTTA